LIKRLENITELNSQSENKIWDWLWKNIGYSKSELKEKSDIASEIVLENRMKPLVGNRIIYPDGTISSYVQRYLRDQVVKLFDVKPKKPVKTPKEL
jgi:hypothetical protein